MLTNKSAEILLSFATIFDSKKPHEITTHVVSSQVLLMSQTAIVNINFTSWYNCQNRNKCDSGSGSQNPHASSTNIISIEKPFSTTTYFTTNVFES